LRGNEGGCGFGKEVELAFAWDGNVSGEGDSEGEAGQLLVWRLGERRRQNLLGGLLVVFVVAGEVVCYVVGEGVWVKVDEGTKEYPQMCRGERRRRVLKDAVEDGFAGLQDFGFAVALGLDLRLLLLELPLALIFPALAFLLVLRSLSLELGLTLRGFLLRSRSRTLTAAI
jgi:hypothetical protein